LPHFENDFLVRQFQHFHLGPRPRKHASAPDQQWPLVPPLRPEMARGALDRGGAARAQAMASGHQAAAAAPGGRKSVRCTRGNIAVETKLV
jgi:hypothetical protein